MIGPTCSAQFAFRKIGTFSVPKTGNAKLNPWLSFLRFIGSTFCDLWVQFFVTELIIFVEASCAALRHVSYNSSPACQRRFVHRPRLIPPGSPNALALLRSLLASDTPFGVAPWHAQPRTKQPSKPSFPLLLWNIIWHLFSGRFLKDSLKYMPEKLGLIS